MKSYAMPVLMLFLVVFAIKWELHNGRSLPSKDLNRLDDDYEFRNSTYYYFFYPLISLVYFLR